MQMSNSLPTPGTKIGSDIVCAVLNNPEERVLIASVVIDMIQRATGVVEILWPLGIHIGFTEECLSVGIFGRKEDREVTHGISHIPAKDITATVGQRITDMWARLKNPPYCLRYVIMGTFYELQKQTKAAHNLP